MQPKKRGRLLALLGLLLLLSGCMMMDSADLLALPRLLPDHAELLKLVGEEAAGGRWATVSPQAGSNRSSVQFVDLYNDGIPEAIVFLANAKEAQLRMLIYSKIGESRYKKLADCALSAVSFQRVEYADLNGNGTHEIIIGQSFGTEASYTATVYTLVNDVPTIVLSGAPYTNLTTHDFNDDGQNELLLLKYDELGQSAYAELFSLPHGDVAMRSLGQAPLSAGVRTAAKITAGRLYKGLPAVVADAYCVLTDASFFLSDVFVLDREAGLQNITFTPQDGYSKITQRPRDRDIVVSDVDFDGFLEVPIVLAAPKPQKVTVPPDVYIRWYAFDRLLAMVPRATTYHSQAGQWYFQYPESWVGKVYTKTAEIDGAAVTTFSIESNGYQYDLLSSHAYPPDTPAPKTENRQFLMERHNMRLYASLPSPSALGELGAQYRLSTFDAVRKRFAWVNQNGENEPLVPRGEN